MSEIDEMKMNYLVGRNDISKIEMVLKKAENGNDIVVAFIGGSITQGCNATLHEDCYAYRTYCWFKEKFKNIDIKYINAGVGATGSIIGVHRVQKQVLDLDPDIVFIDFAVNDKDTVHHKIAYESLVRKLILSEKSPAIIEVFMSNFDGKNVQDQQVEIGNNYNVPMVSFRDAVFTKINKGNLKWEDVATDEVHPNNYGHYIISQLLIRLLEEVYEKVNRIGNAGRIDNINKINKEINPAIFGDKFMNGEILNNKKIKAIYSEGFIEAKKGFQVFYNSWTFNSKTDKDGKIVFNIEGKNIFLLYKKSIKKEAGKLKIKIDNKDEKLVDTYFNDGWGDYTEAEILVEEERKNNHIIEIEVINENKNSEITLLGFLVS